MSGIVNTLSTHKGRYMAQTKQSARQIADAAALTVAANKVIGDMIADPIGVKKTAAKHSKPDGFIGDKPGFFRGARIRK